MSLLTRFRKNTESASSAGFTILELTFVFAIFAIMASIVLFNFRAFNTKVQFGNLVQDIALRIMTAQKSALAGATNVNFIGRSAKPTYGVYFQPGVTATTASTQFVYFNDIPPTGSTTFLGNKLYDPTGTTCPVTPTLGNECLSITSITTGEYVSKICYVPVGDTVGYCITTGSAHISFTRPFPDANIFVDTLGSSLPVESQFACVELSSLNATALKKTITVSNLGELRTIDGAADATTSPCHP